MRGKGFARLRAKAWLFCVQLLNCLTRWHIVFGTGLNCFCFCVSICCSLIGLNDTTHHLCGSLRGVHEEGKQNVFEIGSICNPDFVAQSTRDGDVFTARHDGCQARDTHSRQ